MFQQAFGMACTGEAKVIAETTHKLAATMAPHVSGFMLSGWRSFSNKDDAAAGGSQPSEDGAAQPQQSDLDPEAGGTDNTQASHAERAAGGEEESAPQESSSASAADPTTDAAESASEREEAEKAKKDEEERQEKLKRQKNHQDLAAVVADGEYSQLKEKVTEAQLAAHLMQTTKVRAPEAWQDASSWVAVEYSRAGLRPERPEVKQQGRVLPSPWGKPEEGCPLPESGVLWPHQALHEHRSQPFTPSAAYMEANQEASSDSMQDAVSGDRHRLSQLWRMSSSHGISWDELDEAFVEFAKLGRQRYRKWSVTDSEHINCLAKDVKARTRLDAVKQVRARLGKGRKKLEEQLKGAGDDTEKFWAQREVEKTEDVERWFPSRVRRVHTRLYRDAKKRWLGPWRPGKLTGHLQQLVVARMLQRETEERRYHERSAGVQGR
eukprot:CAMPEP_0178421312 /NCGR_PEP_ID=MMETSP0689_2-20121128/26582_1 /TAXON_ID=160604 /ORGANISM="Amphidinium massartii, Strain CS-259" /LENGTH=436 /DNA_ID=CAMNT_0020042819 /DNA_START=65 /DNA_END=1372 /DNA_ORIENTATION=-